MGDCHYLEGNVYAAKRMDLVRYLLDISGLGQDRLQVRWVSATEGQQFAEYVTELTEILRELGPLDRDQMGLPLAAVSRAINNADLRWLMGIQRQLTERENVYHERLDPDGYEHMLKTVGRRGIPSGPDLCRPESRTSDRAADRGRTGLPIYTISLRLNDLEKISLVTILGHEGHQSQIWPLGGLAP